MKKSDRAEIETLVIQVKRLKYQIDTQSKRLTKDIELFGPISISWQNLIPSELGFLKTISWTYILYYEIGKNDLDFILDQLPDSNVYSQSYLHDHLKLIHHLRTYFQHNLDLSNDRDRAIYNYCQTWFKEQCGSNFPNNNSDWDICLKRLLLSISIFLDSIFSYLQETDAAAYKDNWAIRKNRYHPPHEFDRIINITAADMGRESIDVVKLRKRFLEQWRKELSVLTGNYDFETEARRLVEYTLLNDTFRVLPIDGRDILNEFPHIEPGPIIGEMLRKAKQLYEQKPCDRNELLARLAESNTI